MMIKYLLRTCPSTAEWLPEQYWVGLHKKKKKTHQRPQYILLIIINNICVLVIITNIEVYQLKP